MKNTWINLAIGILILGIIVAIIWLWSTNSPNANPNVDNTATNPNTASYTTTYLSSLGITIAFMGPPILYQYTDSGGIVQQSTNINQLVAQKLTTDP